MIWGWPVTVVTVGHAAEREQVAVGARAAAGASMSRAVARSVAGNPDAHADHLRAALHLGGDGAGRGSSRSISRDRFGRDALQGGLLAVDADVQRVAGQHDAVVDVHHAGHLADGVGHLGRELLQQLLVVGEDLDLDGLRHGGQVADQVLHELQHLDVEAGDGLLDLRAHVVHDLLDGPARQGLQADEEVALVGLGDAAAELQAGAPRVGLHLGRALQDVSTWRSRRSVSASDVPGAVR